MIQADVSANPFIKLPCIVIVLIFTAPFAIIYGHSEKNFIYSESLVYAIKCNRTNRRPTI
jgi:hypothetical protein